MFLAFLKYPIQVISPWPQILKTLGSVDAQGRSTRAESVDNGVVESTTQKSLTSSVHDSSNTSTAVSTGMVTSCIIWSAAAG